MGQARLLSYRDMLLALLAGAITPLAFAPFHITITVFIALAVLFSLWYRSRSVRHSFIYGYLFGFAFFGVGIHWIHISIHLFGGVNLIGAYAATYALVAFLALYPAMLGALNQYLFRQSTCSNLIVVLPCLWALSEWFRSWFLTGFPWLSVGYSQSDTLLAQYAPVLGVYGVSLLVCVSAGALTVLYHAKKSHKLFGLAVILLVWSIAFQLQKVEWTEEKEISLQVAMVQAAIPQELKWKPEQRNQTVQLYQSLSEEHWGKDIIVWPETALPFFYHHAESLMTALQQRAESEGTQLILGLPFKDPDSNDYYNALLNMGMDNDSYLKRHLVPFGEYLPFNKLLRSYLDWLKIPMSSFSAGKQKKPLLKVGSYYLGASICYEDVFGEEVINALPEANVLVNVSNDAWFGDSAAPHQHLQMARMRSIETQRPMLRATNTGISAIIDHEGRIVEQSPQFKPHALSGEVTPRTGITPYIKTGNWFIVGLILALLLMFYERERH